MNVYHNKRNKKKGKQVKNINQTINVINDRLNISIKGQRLPII